jgi:hypothetical protein
MNQTETAFAWMLQAQKAKGEIIDFRFEPIKFILAENIEGGHNAVTYTPDFIVVYPDYFEFVEIKAKGKSKIVLDKSGKAKTKQWSSMRDDARVKINIAATQFPWFKWSVWYALENGEWVKEKVN